MATIDVFEQEKESSAGEKTSEYIGNMKYAGEAGTFKMEVS
ncbi:unnamed protein product [Brassica rapa subsp. narinosa]